MRWVAGVGTGVCAACICLFGALVACGLNLVQRAESDLLGVDRPVPCVGVERESGAHRYVILLLGTSHRLDLEDELALARRAQLRVSLIASDSARRAAAAARRAAELAGRVCARLESWLQDLRSASGRGGDRSGPPATWGDEGRTVPHGESTSTAVGREHEEFPQGPREAARRFGLAAAAT
ncbi:MAG: hypothetical protein ACM3ZO_04335 [Clostridia bacterium]